MNYRYSPVIALLVVSTIVSFAGCGKKHEAVTPRELLTVATTPVTLGSIEQTSSVVGSLDTLAKTQLSAKLAGRVMWINVHEGDQVHAGEVIVRLDPTEAQAQVNQDQANIQNDLAKLAQAKTQYTQSITNANVAVDNAKSVLASSQVTLQKTIVGQQSQQKEQAKDQLLQQQANYNNALTNFNRVKSLYDQGAAAKADLDNAETQYNVQKALLDSYKQALSLAMQGGRSEDVKVAEANVAQNKLSLRNAIANLANVKVNKDAIVAAQASVAQAQAVLAQAVKQLADLNITSPIDGIVSARSTDPGQIASPGAALVTIVDLRTVYFQPTVSDIAIGAIRIGQPVSVSVDSFPGKRYAGTVSAVFPSASATDRTFAIRVSIANDNQELRPGMYARGTIVTSTKRQVVVVPLTSLVPRDQASGYAENLNSTGTATGKVTLPPMQAFIYDHGTAVARNVEIGIVEDQNVEVTQGLSAGDLLIVKGQQMLRDGDKVLLPGQKQPQAKSGAKGRAS